MQEHLISRQIHRCNRNLLLVNAALIVAGLLWAAATQRYLYNCFVGPFPFSHAELVRSIDLKATRYFISINDVKPVESGLQYIETTTDKYTNAVKSKKVTATYFVAPVDGTFLIIKSPQDTPLSSYQGAMVPVSSEVRSWFQKELLDDKHRNFDDVFLPYVLDSSSFRSNAYLSIAIAFPIIVLAAYNVKKALGRFGHPESSPIYKQLAHYDCPSETVAQMIATEFKREGVIVVKSLMLSSSWLLNQTFFNLTVFHVGEIVWAYQKVTSHSYNFIPTGKSYGFIVADKFGRMIERDLGRGKTSQEQAAGFLQDLAARAPWAIYGYSDELKAEYANNRPTLVAHVQERKDSYFNAATPNE